jgi:hypothetical protein
VGILAAVACDGATFCIREMEDWFAMAEWQASERESRAEVEHLTTLASACTDTEGIMWRISLLEGELVEELTLLQTRGSELCHAIVDTPRARHLSKGMQHIALQHTEVDQELATFQAVVSSAVKSVLGHLPGNTACVELVN